MELISKEMQPVAGTEGAFYRRKRLLKQLPIYDQDPSRCQGLTENEVKLMEDFIKKYKSEALGVGEVALPGQGGITKDEGKQPGKNISINKGVVSTNGTLGSVPKGQEFVSIQQQLCLLRVTVHTDGDLHKMEWKGQLPSKGVHSFAQMWFDEMDILGQLWNS